MPYVLAVTATAAALGRTPLVTLDRAYQGLWGTTAYLGMAALAIALFVRRRRVDIERPGTTFPVHYQGPLPDTFQEGADVVVEGKYSAAGGFEATTLLTKCGSRYEAAPEDYLS